MRFRIGVHLGDVAEKDDGTVYGDGVNVAARLQALADGGGITVSDAVRGVVRGRVSARFVDRGEQQLKNIATPIHAFAIDLGGGEGPVRRAAAKGRPPAQRRRFRHRRRRVDRGARGLFVGRRQEMAQLAKALERARQGRGQILLLAGSGGMGKTRLAQEMAARAEHDGVPVHWGRCLEEPGAPPVLAVAPADPQLPARQRRPAAGRDARRRPGRHREHRSRGGRGLCKGAPPGRHRGGGHCAVALPAVRRGGRLLAPGRTALAPGADLRRPALGRRDIAAPVRLPGRGAGRQRLAADRHLPRHRVVAPAPAVRHARGAGALPGFPSHRAGRPERPRDGGIHRGRQRRIGAAPAWRMPSAHAPKGIRSSSRKRCAS